VNFDVLPFETLKTACPAFRKILPKSEATIAVDDFTMERLPPRYVNIS
jgi:hypothetical protein